jgi:hypothetical protein
VIEVTCADAAAESRVDEPSDEVPGIRVVKGEGSAEMG